MKINEKNLAVFATTASQVDREGWLVKKGEMNKTYQKRWFILKGNLLFYFEKKGEKEPDGVIVLEGCTVELAEGEEQFGFKVVFHGAGNRSYIFGAESQESMEQWMKTLACASYDYIKLMVTELQRQLDELQNAECMEQCTPCPPPRHRHNPFNRVDQHFRTQSIRSAPGRPDGASRSIESMVRCKVTFREVHASYGRPILADINEWRYAKREAEKQLAHKDDLISL